VLPSRERHARREACERGAREWRAPRQRLAPELQIRASLLEVPQRFRGRSARAAEHKAPVLHTIVEIESFLARRGTSRSAARVQPSAGAQRREVLPARPPTAVAFPVLIGQVSSLPSY